MPEDAHDPEMTDLEHALSALQPTKGRLDRDRLMFEAGRRSAIAPSRPRWAWPAVAASLAAVVLGQTVALGRRPEPRVVDRLVYIPRPAVAPVDVAEPVVILNRNPGAASSARLDAPAGSPFLLLSRQVERFGLEGLPDPPPLLTLSVGREANLGFVPNAPDVLRRYELDKVLDLGGPL